MEKKEGVASFRRASTKSATPRMLLVQSPVSKRSRTIKRSHRNKQNSPIPVLRCRLFQNRVEKGKVRANVQTKQSPKGPVVVEDVHGLLGHLEVHATHAPRKATEDQILDRLQIADTLVPERRKQLFQLLQKDDLLARAVDRPIP